MASLNGEIYDDLGRIKCQALDMLHESESDDAILEMIERESADLVPRMRVNQLQAALDNVDLMTATVEDTHIGLTVCDVIADAYQKLLYERAVAWFDGEIDDWGRCDACDSRQLDYNLYDQSDASDGAEIEPGTLLCADCMRAVNVAVRNAN